MSYRANKQVITAHMAGRTDGRTHRQTQATTIPEGQNWPRVKNLSVHRLRSKKRHVGQVNLLCIVMFNISKIKPKFILGPIKPISFLSDWNCGLLVKKITEDFSDVLIIRMSCFSLKWRRKGIGAIKDLHYGPTVWRLMTTAFSTKGTSNVENAPKGIHPYDTQPAADLAYDFRTSDLFHKGFISSWLKSFKKYFGCNFDFNHPIMS